MSAITLTFSDVVENHIGNEQLGSLAANGYSLEDLIAIQKQFPTCELIHLNTFLDNDKYKAENAYILIIRDGLDQIRSSFKQELFNEQSGLVPDRQYYDARRKKVLNKHARWNLCFDDVGHVADYEIGQGTVVSFNDLPRTNELRSFLKSLRPDDALKCEANYYYDITRTGIGYHGDTERRQVIGVRLGHQNPLVFRWYNRAERISDEIRFVLGQGDMYIMSAKAVGNDWRRSTLITLRHSAGCRRYTE